MISLYNLINLKDMNITPLIPNTHVCIADKTSPIIIPFGPSDFTKDWLTRRLFRYLREKGYHVSLDNAFVPQQLSSRYIIEGERFLDAIGVRYHMPLLFRTISQYGSPLF